MNRRRFIAQTAAALGGLYVTPRFLGAAESGDSRQPRILLRSSWQSVNIGDIGHTPGALALLERHFPEAEITLWPVELGHGARELLVRAFPRVKIVEGTVDAIGKPTTEALARAWEQADLYLSGSGSNFPSSAHAGAFKVRTGKPIGVFGVSVDPISGIGTGRDPEGGTLAELRRRAMALPPSQLPKALRTVIDQADFFFCRDTITRDFLRSQRVKTPVVEFGPDAQLGMELRDEPRASSYLTAHGLARGKFICVIPRLRYTPYYRIRSRAVRTPDDDVRDAINSRTTETDHAKLREVIVHYVRTTGNRVLACAEMTYQVSLAKEVLVDPLPEDVKQNVVWRDSFWLPDEAASVYRQSQAVLSLECHSPLIALRNGAPAFYLRQPTDTCKGQMYRDFGAADWLFEIGETSGAEIWSALQKIVADPEAATARVSSIMKTVDQLQRRMVAVVRESAIRAMKARP